jgi:beta-glucosidase
MMTLNIKSYSPQYEFGTGLSYSTFEYSNLTIDKSKINTDSVMITIEVKNTGKVTGKKLYYFIYQIK